MIYVSTGGLKLSATSSIKLLKENNIKNIELSGGIYEKDLKKKLLNLKKIKLSIHNYFPVPKLPFVLNIGSTDKKILNKSLKHVCNAINLSSILGIKHYSLHAPFRISLSTDDLGKIKKKYKIENKNKIEKIFKDSLNKLICYAKKKKVKLLIENNVISKENYKKYSTNPFLLTSPNDYWMFINFSR